MNKKTQKTVTEHDFSKKNKVSVWASQYPYEEIPDEYFEETFSNKGLRAKNSWSNNYKLKFFLPENMETNGTAEGMILIKEAAGECSFSNSYMDVLMSKARKAKLEEVTWIILLFDYEFSARLAGVDRDEYTQYLGAFNYDPEAESLYEIDEDE